MENPSWEQIEAMSDADVVTHFNRIAEGGGTGGVVFWGSVITSRALLRSAAATERLTRWVVALTVVITVLTGASILVTLAAQAD